MVKLFYMIRLLSETDLPELILIEQLTQLAPWSEDTFTQCFKLGSRGWVIEHDNRSIGFVILMQQMGECHILNICIHPDYQHQGFGQQLLVYVLKAAKEKNAGIAYLEVRRSNQHAISLYKKMGFVEIGDRKDYYPAKKGREDAILYAKDLGVDDEL